MMAKWSLRPDGPPWTAAEAPTRDGRAPTPRRVPVALLALVQMLVLATAPLVDPPPSLDHQVHLAAASEGGCAPAHDDFHCVVCRVAAGERIAAPGDAGLAPLAALPTAVPAPPGSQPIPHLHTSPDRTRAPPGV